MGYLKPRNIATMLPVALAFILGSSGNTQAQSNAGGPIRLARISFVEGNVSFRPTSQIDWSYAAINQPIRQGAQIWASGGGRAEIQFDDGSVLRLGNGAVVTLQTMSSDSNGEYTDVQVNDGTVTMESRNSASVYQIDGPYASLRTDGQSVVRIDANNRQRIVDLRGTVQVQDQSQQSTLQSGDAIDIGNTNDPLNIYRAPGQDSWDRFNRYRDGYVYPTHRDPYLPYNVSIVAGNLDHYGGWRVVAGYGNVWFPHEDDNWRPYWHGHWVWVDPVGWTWVGNEPWGWAPYHYGTWVHEPYGWGWCPGPETQYWTPAAVSFCNYDNQIGWAPLCPQEVRYPSYISVGFTSGNWAFNFSIGGVACYTPTRFGYCEPHRFDPSEFNRPEDGYRIRNVYNNYTFNNFNGPQGNFGRDVNFVPRNARYGTILASQTGFVGGGHFQPLGRRGEQAFAHGAMLRGENGRFGSSLAVPMRNSLTPSRAFQSASFQPHNLGRRVFAPNSNRFGNNGFRQANPGQGRFGQASQQGRSGQSWHWNGGSRSSQSSGPVHFGNQGGNNNRQGRNGWHWNPPQRSNQSNSNRGNTHWNAPLKSNGGNRRNNNRGGWHWNPPQRSNQSHWNPPQRSNQSHWNPPQRSNQNHWNPPQRSNQSHWNPPQRSNQSHWNPPQRSNQSHWNPPQRSNQSHWNPPQRSNQSHWNPPQRSNQSHWNPPQRSNQRHQNPPQRSNQSRGNQNQSNQRNNFGHRGR